MKHIDRMQVYHDVSDTLLIAEKIAEFIFIQCAIYYRKKGVYILNYV